jgi:hypothetical protein
MKKLICWWFGCDPDYEWPNWYKHGCGLPCKRCGAEDTSYEHRVGLTRHSAFKGWCLRYFVRWWLPAKCCDCFKRYGKHDDCIPF